MADINKRKVEKVDEHHNLNPQSKAISTTIDIDIKCYITVIPCALVVRLICTPSALAGPRALGVYIRQTTRGHGITNK